jgi:hypothetical protein
MERSGNSTNPLLVLTTWPKEAKLTTEGPCSHAEHPGMFVQTGLVGVGVWSVEEQESIGVVGCD